MEGKNPNIIVTVRVRPETQEEQNSQSYKNILRCLDEKVIIFDPADPNKSVGRGAPNNHGRSKDLNFGFDRVFDPYSTQYEVFQHTTRSLINEVLNGFNCTCFAYGATGAGKTFTMIGNKENPGVMVLTMQELFAAMEDQTNTTYDVSISYLEIYNETIRDLLVKASKPLDLRESADAGVQVAGLSSHKPSSADEVLQLLEVGNSRRCQSATGANAQSSRSHAVLQICVEKRDRTANVSSEVKMGKLSLIDLAGSERASRTKTRGQQLVEGANINKSLLALGNCINALGQDYKEGKYVPYRNSKLTRLLKDSLGGNCKTVMIANVSPSSLSYEDTYNTLNYANRAKNIKTKVHTNQINVKAHVSEYKELIDRLRAEIAELKGKMKEYESSGRTSSGDAREKAAADELRAEIGRAVQDRHTLQTNLKQIQDRKIALQEQKESVLQKIDDWETQKWHKLSTTKISGALGAAAELKPPASPMEVHQARKKLQDIMSEEQEACNKEQSLFRRLERHADDAKEIHNRVPSRITSDMSRRQLERDLSIHWLELEKMNRDVEIQRQNMTIRALEKQLSKAFVLLEHQHEILMENDLVDRPTQHRFDSLMLTPNRQHSRTTTASRSPFLKVRSPIVIAEPDVQDDLPALVEQGDDTHDAPITVDLSSTFTAVSMSAGKENRNENAAPRAAVGPKPILKQPVRGRFGFSTVAPRQPTTSIRKTPTKSTGLLQLRRTKEDKYPATFKPKQNSAPKTPQGNKTPRWTPVDKKVRFVPEVPTPTAVGGSRETCGTPTKLSVPESHQSAEEPNEVVATQEKEEVRPQPPPSQAAQFSESLEQVDLDEFPIPEPPPRMTALAVAFGH
eukprot:TRINITY_DN8281_c0_g1_i1.p1 TRINITY_DN8281_c0_g1~~TRINITY_DN8281_c0_g1_i1.p1  ORF type:complete len:853 (+),score=182.29 TRINITY_DN8281_c0_g1_i1:169-2727(+)